MLPAASVAVQAVVVAKAAAELDHLVVVAAAALVVMVATPALNIMGIQAEAAAVGVAKADMVAVHWVVQHPVVVEHQSRRMDIH